MDDFFCALKLRTLPSSALRNRRDDIHYLDDIGVSGTVDAYTAIMANTWSNRMPICRYTVIFEPAEEGGYVVHVPALDGAATQGETLEEAREMAKDLIIGYSEALAKDGVPAPVEELEPITEPVREVLEVALN
jgi:predicted RNase H-like HicB family nuclease